jgi:hypothetical protein
MVEPNQSLPRCAHRGGLLPLLLTQPRWCIHIVHRVGTPIYWRSGCDNTISATTGVLKSISFLRSKGESRENRLRCIMREIGKWVNVNAGQVGSQTTTLPYGPNAAPGIRSHGNLGAPQEKGTPGRYFRIFPKEGRNLLRSLTITKTANC